MSRTPRCTLIVEQGNSGPLLPTPKSKLLSKEKLHYTLHCTGHETLQTFPISEDSSDLIEGSQWKESHRSEIETEFRKVVTHARQYVRCFFFWRPQTAVIRLLIVKDTLNCTAYHTAEINEVEISRFANLSFATNPYRVCQRSKYSLINKTVR